MNRIELLKFYDYLGDNGVLKKDEIGKGFKWLDNFNNSCPMEKPRTLGENEQTKEDDTVICHIKYDFENETETWTDAD